jgi:hypothetical protein
MRSSTGGNYNRSASGVHGIANNLFTMPHDSLGPEQVLRPDTDKIIKIIHKID